MTEHTTNDPFHSESFLQGHNLEYVEQLQARYAEDRDSVDASLQAFCADAHDINLTANCPAGLGEAVLKAIG